MIDSKSRGSEAPPKMIGAEELTSEPTRQGDRRQHRMCATGPAGGVALPHVIVAAGDGRDGRQGGEVEAARPSRT